MAELNYEPEIRYVIDDYESLVKKLKKLGAKVVLRKVQIDHYYIPKASKDWNLNNKSMRIREEVIPKRTPELLFSDVEIFSYKGFKIKKSKFKKGKLTLYKGDIKTCKNILGSLGFKPWFVINKDNCEFWYSKKVSTLLKLEHIKNLGWTAELQLTKENLNASLNELKRAIDLFEIPKSKLSYKPISVIYYEKVIKNKRKNS